MLKVYMTGLIYFDGCNASESHALAPDGRSWEVRHDASLFIDASLVGAATTWWDGSRIPHEFPVSIEGEGRIDAQVIEFRMPDPVTISFSDPAGELHCADLDPVLAKLHFEASGGAQPFSLGADPQTIAEVTLHSGTVRAGHYAEVGLIEWTIPNPAALQITATLKAGGESKTIVLTAPAAGEVGVLFANIHDVFVPGSKKDVHAAVDEEHSHVPVFGFLNPGSGATVVSKRPRGPIPTIDNRNAMISRLKELGFTCGDTPPCCCKGGTI